MMKKKDTYWKEYNIFATNCSKLFDIIGDSDKIKGQELLWGVKMTASDWQFYKNMFFLPQIGYSSNIDKKGEKTENRKQKTEEKQKKRKAEAIEYEMNLSRQSSSTDFLYDSKENNLLEDEYCP